MPKVREVIRRLERDGWILKRMKGDHRQYKRPDRSGGIVTVAGHLNDDIPEGTWNSIQKQAGWKEENRA